MAAISVEEMAVVAIECSVLALHQKAPELYHSLAVGIRVVYEGAGASSSLRRPLKLHSPSLL